MYLDIVTIHTPIDRLKRAHGLLIHETVTEAKQFMRVRDDRVPGEEMLIPLEKLDESEPADRANNEKKDYNSIGQQLLLEPF